MVWVCSGRIFGRKNSGVALFLGPALGKIPPFSCSFPITLVWRRWESLRVVRKGCYYGALDNGDLDSVFIVVYLPGDTFVNKIAIKSI